MALRACAIARFLARRVTPSYNHEAPPKAATMIVTCPACNTRYLIDPRALGVTGRSVRCTQCDHVWMQLPPEDAPRRVDLPAPGAAVRPQPARLAPPSRGLPPPPPAELPPLADPPPLPPRPPRDAVPSASTAAAADVARGSNRPLVIALVAVVVLGALWYGRFYIVGRVPALEPVYALFGIGIAAGDPRSDLEFRGVTSNRRQDNGRATLEIAGEVANVSQAARRVPPLRITLEDAGKHAIESWTVVATGDPLPPGESVPFHSSVADPGANTVGASVAFDNGTD
jgi:predicted Zn finger-like uncharacterized protein